MGNRNGLKTSVAALVLLGAAGVGWGDRFVLKNGRVVEGEVTREDDAAVSVEVSSPGSVVTQKLAKGQIKTWTKAPREGPAYVTLPVFGVVGRDVTVEGLAAGLAAAREAKAKYVVLAVDSPGGSVEEMAGIIDLIAGASKDVEIVAYVKNAQSAAAVIAMTCGRVYARADAVIGAAVPFRMTENGPVDVDAKFRSIIEAKMRAATAHGGHADLLVRGMAEMGLEIYLTEEDGRPVLRTTGPGKRIKSRGQILSLTGKEAEACGLAHVAGDMDEVGRLVAGGAWHEPNRRAWNAVVGNVAGRREQARYEHERGQRALAGRYAVAELDQRINALLARAAQIVEEIPALKARAQGEIRQVDSEYTDAMGRAPGQKRPQDAMFQASTSASERVREIKRAYEAEVTRLQAEGRAAVAEAERLRREQKELIATLPGE